jgi:uncharacterized RDD family membrane protein YckC
MQFYLSRKGERLGPFSIYTLSEMIKEGEVSPDDLGWYQGREEWTPLSEIPALMSVIAAKREGDFQRESGKPIDTTRSGKAKGARDRDSSSDRVNPIDPAPGTPSTSSATDSASTSVSDHRATAAADASTLSKARPVSRFWARIFDYLLVVVAVYALFGAPPFPPELMDGSASFSELTSPQFWQRMREAMETPEALRLARIQQAGLVVWLLLEGFLLHRFGTTPGKALFALRVSRVEGGRLGLQQAMFRAFFVWFAGVGMWLPILSLLTLAFSIWSLKTRGNTVWDRQLGTLVQQGKLTIGRIVLAFAAFLAIVLVQQAIVTAN